ncbi:hypothetical protein ACQAYK_03935 [Acidithiobacillus sp. AC3]
MIVTLKTQGLQTLDQIRAFVEGAQGLDFAAPAREEAYDWIAGELRRFQYAHLGKVARGWMRRYLEKVTGLSRAQVTRLISQFRAGGQIRDRRGQPSKPFPRRYTTADVQALAAGQHLAVGSGQEAYQNPAMETYKIRRISRRSGSSGITQPAVGTLDALLKFDGNEAPHCVYNEIVALRLAQTLRMPIADGVLVTTGDGPTYASLLLHSPGISLPDVLNSQLDAVAQRYPQQAASLLAFDLWIGNGDRARNLKAVLATAHIQLFAGFDHSHALLGADKTPEDSIRALREGRLLVQSHPFYGRVRKIPLGAAFDRIQALSDVLIRECCVLGKPFRGVSEAWQEDLAGALIRRQSKLFAIYRAHAQAFGIPV